jgi:hypothetical protein
MPGRVIRNASGAGAMRSNILAGLALAGGAARTDAEGGVGDPRHVDHNGISPVARR